jgi:uncharacterized membrane protein YvbJ
MFCPKCAAENDVDKSYCRQCGQPLAAVRLALEGRVDEAIKTVAGDKMLSGYRFRIGVAGLVILTAILTILTGVQIGFKNIQSAAVVLILVMILFLHLSRQYHRVARLLDTEEQSSTPNLPGSPGGQNQLRDGTAIVVPASITEQSTLELKREE